MARSLSRVFRGIKNSSGYDGDDCAWVDFVQWTGPSPAQACAERSRRDPANWQEIAYKHDVLGRRVEKKVDGYSTRYVYDGPHVIAEYDGNNNLLRKYIFGPGIDQPVSMIEVADANAVYYYHFDALGSVVALSDAAGDTVQTYEYSVYGEVAVEDANHPNPYMFAGVRYDIEIGLYYNRARYYNPYIGRFLQTDPIGYSDGMNMYAYCGNNSLNCVDPSGLSRKYWTAHWVTCGTSESGFVLQIRIWDEVPEEGGDFMGYNFSDWDGVIQYVDEKDAGCEPFDGAQFDRERLGHWVEQHRAYGPPPPPEPEWHANCGILSWVGGILMGTGGIVAATCGPPGWVIGPGMVVSGGLLVWYDMKTPLSNQVEPVRSAAEMREDQMNEAVGIGYDGEAPFDGNYGGLVCTCPPGGTNPDCPVPTHGWD